MDGSRTPSEDLALLTEEDLKGVNPLRRRTKGHCWRQISHGLFDTLLIGTIVILVTMLFFGGIGGTGKPEVKITTVVPKC